MGALCNAGFCIMNKYICCCPTKRKSQVQPQSVFFSFLSSGAFRKYIIFIDMDNKMKNIVKEILTEIKKPMKYKMIKLYDCQDFPDNIKKYFFNRHGRSLNDIVIEVLINRKGDDILSDYLIEDGNEWDDTVFIKHWW